MENNLDKLIGFFSPKSQLKRAGYRTALDSNKRAYEAAGKGRRVKNWKTSGASANGETELSIKSLRDRSRDLVRNNPYAKKAVNVLTTNVIGSGLQPTPTGSKTQLNKVKDIWRTWSQSIEGEAGRQMNFLGVQRLAFRSMVESGECLVRRVWRKTNTPGMAPFCLQVLEADFIDHSKTMLLPTGGRIVQGVEFDGQGLRVAYWLFESHPGEPSGMLSFGSKRVPAEDLIHLYVVDRPGQVRGVPFGVASFVRMRDLDSYSDATLVRQQIAACWVGFIQDGVAMENFTGGTTAPEYNIDRVEPGMIETLPAGKTITFGTPPPAEGYDSYTRTVLREIACAYGITYEALTGDLSNVNFSSARMGWLEFGKLVEELQDIVFVPQFANQVWGWFMEAAIIGGLIKKSVPATWTAPRRQFVDPLKETKALVEMVRAGFISWQEAVKQMGYEPDEVSAEMKADYEMFDNNGFVFSVDPRKDTPPPGPEAPPEKEDS